MRQPWSRCVAHQESSSEEDEEGEEESDLSDRGKGSWSDTRGSSGGK